MMSDLIQKKLEIHNGKGPYNDYIRFLNISKNFTGDQEDIFQYVEEGSINKYILQILKIKNMKFQNNIFYHLKHGSLKICVYLAKKILFCLGADDSIEFQILEAIIEQVIIEFNNYCKNNLWEFENLKFGSFHPFKETFLGILSAINSKVKVINTYCRGCDQNIKIHLKKSILDMDWKTFPIPFVYIHKGHGLLIYIDHDFRVRGSEIVITSS